MKDKIKEICNKLNREQLSVHGATEELLILFGVSGSVADTVGRNCPFCGEPCAECSHKTIDR